MKMHLSRIDVARVSDDATPRFRWRVTALYESNGSAVSFSKLHEEYGAAVASMGNDTPLVIDVQVA